MKDLDTGLLANFYGELLSAKAAKIMRMYYDADMSLAEIAGSEGMTRQGVSDYIKRGGAAVNDYEDKLGLMRRFYCIRDLVAECKRLVDEGADKGAVMDGLDNILRCFD